MAKRASSAAQTPAAAVVKKATRRQLARWVAQRAELSQRRAYALVGEVLSGIAAALAAGGTVELRGFGTFWVQTRGPRTIQVPGVGAVKVKGTQDVRFRPGVPLEKTVRQAAQLPSRQRR